MLIIYSDIYSSFVTDLAPRTLNLISILFTTLGERIVLVCNQDYGPKTWALGSRMSQSILVRKSGYSGLSFKNILTELSLSGRIDQRLSQAS